MKRTVRSSNPVRLPDPIRTISRTGFLNPCGSTEGPIFAADLQPPRSSDPVRILDPMWARAGKFSIRDPHGGSRDMPLSSGEEKASGDRDRMGSGGCTGSEAHKGYETYMGS